MRINRYLAQAGHGSRRHCEQLVREGRVSLNGQPVTELATQVGEGDRVTVDGRPAVARASGRVLLLHKPVGVVSSMAPQGELPCLADLLGDELRRGRLFHVGRLDADSRGLLLLSDDGELGHRLTHPSHPVWKRYHLQLDRPLDDAAAGRFRRGEVELDGRPCLPARLRWIDPADRQRVEVELREGRNRQLRRVFHVLGPEVVDLLRVAFGPLELGDLPEGRWREASAGELTALRRAAGGVDAPGDRP